MNLKLLACIGLLALGGCSTTPQKKPIDMRHYSTPSADMAGVYFYQWKTGIIGAGSDVKFVVNDKVLGKINTGEWLYIEVPAGSHKYRVIGGLFPQSMDFNFESGQNYFFRGYLYQAMDVVIWVNNQPDIDDATANIKSGRYEQGDAD